jgi:hypothetical protein
VSWKAYTSGRHRSDDLGGTWLLGPAKLVRKVREQLIDPSHKVFRKAGANIISGFFEARRLHVPRQVSRIRAPVRIRHESQIVMMKIGLGMQQKLDMTPILELTISVSQFRSTLKLGKSICMLRSKNRDAENEFGDGMAGLRTRDFGIAADLNRQIDNRNHDADRADDLPEIGEVSEIHTLRLRESVKLLNR